MKCTLVLKIRIILQVFLGDFVGFSPNRTKFLGCSPNKSELGSRFTFRRFMYRPVYMITFPSSWNYEIRKFTFYRAVTTEYLDSKWYTTKFQAEEDDVRKIFDTRILQGEVKLPSAEDLLLQCYSFLMIQECR